MVSVGGMKGVLLGVGVPDVVGVGVMVEVEVVVPVVVPVGEGVMVEEVVGE